MDLNGNLICSFLCVFKWGEGSPRGPGEMLDFGIAIPFWKGFPFLKKKKIVFNLNHFPAFLSASGAAGNV